MQNFRGFSLLRRNSAGFTFLELLVVFSIMGILTSVGFASFVSYSKKQVLDQAVQDLKTGIDQAKFSAESRVKPTVSPCSDSAPLDRYRIRVCTGVVCSSSSDLYETDAGCVVGGAVSWTSSILASKKRPSTLTATVSQCGANSYIQFLTLSGVVTPCTIVVGYADGSAYNTLCVDNGGNTSIKGGNTTCP